MIHMIYMAAGNSRRFGRNKLLADYCGKALFRHGLDMLWELVQERREVSVSLHVVTQYEEIMDYCRMQGIPAVESPESVDGASYTIKNGIKALRLERILQEEDYLMFTVADQPKLSRKSVEKLICEVVGDSDRDSRKIISLAYGGRPGNPKLFPEELTEELMQLSGDEGGRTLVKRYGMKMVLAEEAEELSDIDLPTDL